MYAINESIKSNQVFLIDRKVQVSLAEALRMADVEGLDLVEFNVRDGVSYCKLMNYEKYQYEQHRKERQQRAANKPVKQKVIQVGFKIADHDLEIDAGKADEWLSNGQPVVFRVRFPGRAITFINTAGPAVIERFLGMLSVSYKADKPSVKGNFYSVTVHTK